MRLSAGHGRLTFMKIVRWDLNRWLWLHAGVNSTGADICNQGALAGEGGGHRVRRPAAAPGGDSLATQC